MPDALLEPLTRFRSALLSFVVDELCSHLMYVECCGFVSHLTKRCREDDANSTDGERSAALKHAPHIDNLTVEQPAAARCQSTCEHHLEKLFAHSDLARAVDASLLPSGIPLAIASLRAPLPALVSAKVPAAVDHLASVYGGGMTSLLQAMAASSAFGSAVDEELTAMMDEWVTRFERAVKEAVATLKRVLTEEHPLAPLVLAFLREACLAFADSLHHLLASCIPNLKPPVIKPSAPPIPPPVMTTPMAAALGDFSTPAPPAKAAAAQPQPPSPQSPSPPPADYDLVDRSVSSPTNPFYHRPSRLPAFPTTIWSTGPHINPLITAFPPRLFPPPAAKPKGFQLRKRIGARDGVQSGATQVSVQSASSAAWGPLDRWKKTAELGTVDESLFEEADTGLMVVLLHHCHQLHAFTIPGLCDLANDEFPGLESEDDWADVVAAYEHLAHLAAAQYVRVRSQPITALIRRNMLLGGLDWGAEDGSPPQDLWLGDGAVRGYVLDVLLHMVFAFREISTASPQNVRPLMGRLLECAATAWLESVKAIEHFSEAAVMQVYLEARFLDSAMSQFQTGRSSCLFSCIYHAVVLAHSQATPDETVAASLVSALGLQLRQAQSHLQALPLPGFLSQRLPQIDPVLQATLKATRCHYDCFAR
ncbi:hypothetical protein PAPYR_4238 [Paratrimastix pyriformis]|uniref:Exocyst complex component n=1 Tax=Paratrimastix pyriformis TaxID=342808 RepID=A0ABQ8ULZ4_9EUKA|nr:hypothetical protein PAPYR_4238 [Paratrimastix pyriformis]